MASPSPLKQLANLIVASVERIDAACNTQGVSFPSLDEPISPSSEEIRHQPDVSQAINVIVAAATQLIATARVPTISVVTLGLQWAAISSLGVANDTNIPEILREAGPQGLHVNEIAKKNGLDPARIGRVLRTLATIHVFKEVKPDVFANNALSSVLDTGKPIEALLEDPMGKHDGTSGIPAIVGHTTDEVYRAGTQLSTVLRDPKWGHSQEPTEAALNKAFNTPLPPFEWLELPENAYRLRRFGVGMDGTSKIFPAGAVLQVADVAGGIGSVSMIIAKAYPHLKIFVEDREQVVPEAKKFWDSSLPDALSSGRVSLVPIDMFAAQPAVGQNADLYILRQILHDWSDKYAAKILTQLRAAAGSKSKLLVIESILSYACEQPADELTISGAQAKVVAPAPLLPNFGGAGAPSYFGDLLMLAIQNGQERTLLHFSNLLKSTGWELKEVRRPPTGIGHSYLVSMPV
ncbi:hypothetical protein EWM64_g1487 [Hericium alpestre]|uniref:Uncharacterized protein n=1 Tax=Hericium alpestre TaxID=135208 RepID=A0A4Z0A865_9AGAM|nr:hypothetical protein EWM64_g1487 [Hericium alpestre]